MENEFLHKINVSKVLQETGLDINGIAELVNVDVQTVYRWAWDKKKKGNRPKFNAMVRLLQNGATVETLFGVEYTKVHQQLPKEFREGVELAERPMTKDEIIALFKSMKENGEL